MVELKLIEPSIGIQTCMGVGNGPYPMIMNNSFSFENGLRCVNMGAENLEEAVKRFGIEKLRCYIIDDKWAIVCDNRIPSDWLCRVDFKIQCPKCEGMPVGQDCELCGKRKIDDFVKLFLKGKGHE